MLSVFVNAWKVKDIRKKLFYVLLILAIYRIGCVIPLPGINGVSLLAYKSSSSTNTLYSMMMSGGTGSIFALGIGPYINSSIIMQLLTVALPPLERLQKEGEEGRKKINQYTRVVAVVLALIQGAGTVYSLNTYDVFVEHNWFYYITAVVALVMGTIFIMWISELLTEKAVGNGSSFIIFSNILSGIPGAILALGSTALTSTLYAVIVAAIIVIFAVMIAFVVWIQDGERRIPVQYSKKMVGRTSYGGQSSSIPIKVNIAGVMSIIFAVSLLQLPQVIYQFVQPTWLATVVEWLSLTHPCGAILYVFLIFCFTFFYTSFAINPIEMAENLKKNGGFIPGIRPGKPTSDYIQRTVDRLSWIGAFFYAVIAIIPVLIQAITGVSIGIGGTTLLIVTGVALELVKQLESQLLMRHYKGFLNV